MSKRLINLLRHNRDVDRERDGAIQFSKIKSLMRDYSLSIQNWSDNRWLACLAAGGGPKRRYQYCSDYLGSIIYLRALQGHSGDSIIDLALQDPVLISPGVFLYIYHVGSNFNIPSILNIGLIPGGLELSGRQSVFFLPVDPRDENHQDPENCRVVLDTCKTRGKDIRIRYSGLILIRESSKKDGSFIKQDRTQSSFKVYFHQDTL